MNLLDSLARATRFFARLQSFDLECPHCGTVYQVRLTNAKAKKFQKPWDPWTARFTCTNQVCHRSYVLGILAWPITQGNPSCQATPEDQVPSPRQLSQMRKEGGGWWLSDQDAQRLKRPHTTNVTGEQERPYDDGDNDPD